MSAPAAAGAAAFNPLAMQMNVKANASDLNAYLRDLQGWTSDVKAKDQALAQGKLTLTKAAAGAAPIRGASASKAAEPVVLPSSASADSARYEAAKSAGNADFSAGRFEASLAHYSAAMVLAPLDVVAPSNRAQALLKLERWHEAESDATLALELDQKHVKSYFRRAQARKQLRKYLGAVEDAKRCVELDAANKPAAALLAEAKTLLAKQQAAKAAASQPIVSTKPVAAPIVPAAVASVAPTAATATGGRRMVIQEDDDSDDEETVPVQTKAAAAPAAATSTPAVAAPATKMAATPAAVPAAAPAAAVAATAAASPSSPSSATASSSSSNLRAPSSAYDFDSTFRQIRGDVPAIAAYLKLVPLAAYATMLKTALDGNLLKAAVQAITEVLLPAGDLRGVFDILHGLMTVPRFGVARMMLASGDKKALTSALSLVASKPSEANTDEDTIKKVAKEWAITL